MNINYKRIGNHLKRARSRVHLTQAELAEKLEIAENTYGNMERGAQRPSLYRIIQCCMLLKIKPGDVLNDCIDVFITYDQGDFCKDDKLEYKELCLLLRRLPNDSIHLIHTITKAILDDSSKK